MSQPIVQVLTCPATGKIPYATRAKAVTVCKLLIKRNKRSEHKIGPAEPYRCIECHHFHIGHVDFRKALK